MKFEFDLSVLDHKNSVKHTNLIEVDQDRLPPLTHLTDIITKSGKIFDSGEMDTVFEILTSIEEVGKWIDYNHPPMTFRLAISSGLQKKTLKIGYKKLDALKLITSVLSPNGYKSFYDDEKDIISNILTTIENIAQRFSYPQCMEM